VAEISVERVARDIEGLAKGIGEKAEADREAAAVLDYVHGQAERRRGNANLLRELEKRSSVRTQRAQNLIFDSESDYARAAFIRRGLRNSAHG
jgi:hypothetical protein